MCTQHCSYSFSYRILDKSLNNVPSVVPLAAPLMSS